MCCESFKYYICNDCGHEFFKCHSCIITSSDLEAPVCPECGSKNISKKTTSSDAELLDEKDSKSSTKSSFFDLIIEGFIIVIVVFVLLFELIKDLASTIKLKKKSTPAPEVDCAEKEIVKKTKDSEVENLLKELEKIPAALALSRQKNVEKREYPEEFIYSTGKDMEEMEKNAKIIRGNTLYKKLNL